MSKQRIASATILSLFLACLLSSAASAVSSSNATLGDLVSDPNAKLTTLDGVLTFENFEVSLDGVLAGLNLDIFEVEVFDSSFGFRIIELDGPISAFAGTIGSMVIGFDVAAADGSQIVGVGLNFVATAVGGPASASISETVNGASGNTTTMQVIREAPGGQQIPSAVGVLGTPEVRIHVTKEILVDARNGGILASISEIEQSFETAIPEPSAATLFGLGALLFGSGFRRVRGAAQTSTLRSSTLPTL